MERRKPAAARGEAPDTAPLPGAVSTRRRTAVQPLAAATGRRTRPGSHSEQPPTRQGGGSAASTPRRDGANGQKTAPGSRGQTDAHNAAL